MTAGDRSAGELVDGSARPPLLRDRIRLLRNRLIASHRFRRLASHVPILRGFANRSANELFAITSGFVHSQILFALVELDLLQRLMDEPASLEELGRFSGIPHPRLERLLLAGETIGLTARMADGRWTAGDHGALVASDDGIRAMVRHHAMLYEDLSDPVRLIRGNSPDTRLAAFWAYAGNRQADVGRDEADEYSELMATSQSMLADEVLDAYPFARHRRLLDIGGGDGVFLAKAGERNPELQLCCFDLPPVSRRASEFLERAGMGHRASALGGDFFADDFPEADVTTLVRILCDHDDAGALRLLRNIRRQMRPDDRLVIAEAMRGASRGARLSAAYFHFYFLAMGSGHCRSPEELGELLRRAGFTGYRLTWCATRLLAGIIIARP